VRRATAILAAAALAAILASAPCSCAGTPEPAAGPAPATKTAPAQSASSGGEADEHAREVAWDESVRADFSREVPRFAQKLAKAKLEEMARDNGTYFVDRALYDEAMA
jgi:hypothetical protein